MIEFRRYAACVLAAASFAALPATPASAAQPRGGFDEAVLAEINYARTHPAEYAENLREYRGGGRAQSRGADQDQYRDPYRGSYGRDPYGGRYRRAYEYGQEGDDDRYAPSTYEGYSAIDEAIRFLQQQKPLPPLAGSEGLHRSAGGYAEQQGESGQIGHVGMDGSGLNDRLHRAGVWSSFAAEAISYGQADAASVVRQLIIDDGVADRGHRKILFDRYLKLAGVGCGPHRTYGHLCVIDFSGAEVVR